ncbi:MAG TPA: T9SS type A sorting domain-containing protein [Chitinophagales bacterium]|nr:T9SS type A sorting domain-containing protein [Chitinophagales bacterium]
MESRKFYPPVFALISAVLLLCNSAAAQVSVQSDLYNVLQDACSDYLDVAANDQLGGAVFTLSISNNNPALHGSASVNGSYVSYCPNPGYTGADDFDYEISVGGQIRTGTVYINVLSSNNQIFAGDADQNGKVENYDVLTLGLAYELVGPSRANFNSIASLAWQPSPFVNSDPGAADCNGDGIVEAQDLISIDDLYGDTYPGNSNYEVELSQCRSGAPFYIRSLSGDTVNDGDSLEFEIILGDTQSVIPAYGIAFTLSFDGGFIGADRIDFEPAQSWLLQNDQGLFLKKDFNATGKVDVALSRTDHNPATGGGVLLRARLPIDDNIDGITKAPGWYNLQLQLSATRLVSEYNVVQDVCIQQPSLMVYKNGTGISERKHSTLKLYPNPAGSDLFIEADKILEIELTDITGQKIYTYNTGATNKVRVNLQQLSLAAGAYFVKVRTAEFTNTKKIFVQH